MTITCCIRYEIDPFKIDLFQAHSDIPTTGRVSSRAWAGICGATLHRVRAATTRRVD